MKTQHPTPNGGKSKEPTVIDGKGGAKSVKFPGLGPSGNYPVIEDIPGNEVNVATRQINLANALVVVDWGRKN